MPTSPGYPVFSTSFKDLKIFSWFYLVFRLIENKQQQKYVYYGDKMQ